MAVTLLLSSLFPSTSSFKHHCSPKPKPLPPISAAAFRPLRAAVIGGGPADASAAEALASGDVETFLIERSPSGSKPCGGAIPLCMLQKFSLPDSLVDRRLTRMRIISPSNRAADFGRSLRPGEYIPVLRREVLDAFLRSRAARSSTPFSAPAPPTPAPISSLSLPTTPTSPYLIRYTASPSPGAISGVQHELPVDVVIDADGANSRVARSISAGDYATAIAFRLKRGLGVPEMRTCDRIRRRR